MNIRHFFQGLIFLFSFFIINALYAAPIFPELTGRVVDNAHILKPETISQLDTLLADYERGTSNQVVVVTLPTLQGYSIEDFGYQLGRYWKIGQAGKNNGVLLVIAPNERKMRIEVGYGLEPILTDAISSSIVQGIMLPSFRAGQLEQGVVKGTQAVVNVLGGKSIAIPQATTSNDQPLPMWFIIIFIFIFLWAVIRHPLLAAIFLTSRGSRFGGGGGGGGFSGGGGGFGGGGSSGSW
jgi:uncharacterized protein